MSKHTERIRTQIDFRPTRGHQDADLLYTVLMHYNRGGNTNMTASQLISKAFSMYDASETIDVTRLIDVRNRAKTFMRFYDISKKSDIAHLITDTTINDISSTLIEPDKKFLCLDKDDPQVIKLWDILSSVRFRDRGSLINMWLYQYFAHGNCEYYSRLCAARLMTWMRNEYDFSKTIETDKLNIVINCLWVDSLEIEENEKVINVIPLEEATDEDRLRALMGIKTK